MEMEIVNKMITDRFTNVNDKNKSYFVLSLDNGLVVHTFATSPTILGFPKNVWLGRSFVDFINLKDVEIFYKEFVNIIIPLKQLRAPRNDLETKIFARLRINCGLKSLTLDVVHSVFKLTIKSTQYYTKNQHLDYFLIIEAIPIQSPYKIEKELVQFGKFETRHNAASILVHVGDKLVENFGYLPQDIVNKSIFDFYHPCDMFSIKEIYKTIITINETGGNKFISKPYRFAVQNGDYVLIETEWYTYVDPWKKQLEFVVGVHRVLQGPKHIDIFSTPYVDGNGKLTVKILKESKKIQHDILLLLNKRFIRTPRSSAELAKLSIASKHFLANELKINPKAFTN